MLRIIQAGSIRADSPTGEAIVTDAVDSTERADSSERELGQFIPLHYHYVMLQDEYRVQAFQAAINQLVRPGMRVVELGGGTGILSSFAARRGANVTAVERNPVLVENARRFLQLNHLSEYVEVVQQDAMHFVPSEPVDVVICEMLHVAMLREKQLQVIEAFKQNYRQAFGEQAKLPIFIPEASILMVQPVQQSFDYAGYWAPTPTFQTTESEAPRTLELAPLEVYSTISYDEAYDQTFDCSLTYLAETAAEFNAVRFVTQNILAIDEQQQSATTWANQSLVIPIAEPTAVEQGQPLQISFAYQSGGNLEDVYTTLSGSATVDTPKVQLSIKVREAA